MPDRTFTYRIIHNFSRRLNRSAFLTVDQKVAVLDLFFQALAVTAIETHGSEILENIMEAIHDDGLEN